MNTQDPIELEYSEGNVTDRDELKRLGILAYGEYENILSHEGWKAMLGNLQNDAAFDHLLTQATPLLCRHGNVIAGVVYVVLSGHPTAIFQSDWAYIRKLGVLPEYRGRGIARTLLQNCIDFAKQRKEKTLALHTSGFQKAWTIYEGLGFRYSKDAGEYNGQTYWLYTLKL